MTATEINIGLTDKAKDQITKIMASEGKEGAGLRIGVKSGGCSGLSYFMEFKEAPLANDHIIEFGDVKLFVDVFSVMYLNGSQLDFSDGLNGTGFNWSNPNASRTCGCGESFSA